MADPGAAAQRINDRLAQLWEAAERTGPRYQDFGLTSQQHVILSRLLAAPESTAGALTADLGVTKGAMSQHLTALERDGFIVREPSPHDRRVQLLRLGARGEAYRADWERYDAALTERYTAHLSGADMEEIEAALAKLARAFEA